MSYDSSVNSKALNRDLRLDILKCLGILSVILAHVAPHKSLLFQLRNFDVPMMVIVSGILFQGMSKKKYSYGQYLLKRILRLIAPVWIFLLLFFGITWLVSWWQNKSYPFAIAVVIRSFFLTNGINYLWIIKVFVLIAIASPILLHIRNKISKNSSFLICLAIIYAVYELLLFLVEKYLTNVALPKSLELLVFYLVINVLFYVLPYSCVFGIGLAIKEMKPNQILWLALGLFSIFVTLAFYYYQQNGFFIPTQRYKLLPRLYYISYGVSMSLFVYLGVGKLYKNFTFLFKSSLLSQIIIFISSSSLWIFLWHIVFLNCLDLWVSLFPNLRHYSIKYLVVLFLSIGVTWIQKELVRTIIERTYWGKQQQYWLKTLFLQ
ncbi:MAG: acyltransferase family protein [Pleurocapsa sp.]